MECTAESRENRGIVKRHYGEWGPVIFDMPRGDLTYTCTTDGGYSAVRLGALAKTECVFVNDANGLWVDLAGVASKRSSPLTAENKQRKRAIMGFTDALQKAFRTSQHAGLGVGMQVRWLMFLRWLVTG